MKINNAVKFISVTSVLLPFESEPLEILDPQEESVQVHCVSRKTWGGVELVSTVWQRLSVTIQDHDHVTESHDDCSEDQEESVLFETIMQNMSIHRVYSVYVYDAYSVSVSAAPAQCVSNGGKAAHTHTHTHAKQIYTIRWMIKSSKKTKYRELKIKMYQWSSDKEEYIYIWGCLRKL